MFQTHVGPTTEAERRVYEKRCRLYHSYQQAFNAWWLSRSAEDEKAMNDAWGNYQAYVRRTKT